MALFNLSDPFMKALRAVNQISIGQTTLSEDDLKRQRSSMELASKLATPPIGVSTEKIQVNDMIAEWNHPDFVHNTSKIILYCHGGGYTSGGIGYARILASKLALHTGLSVLSFEYRLAPEHPYPAPFIDGMSMWDYLMHLGYGAKDVILAGDSAGGNMALAIVQTLHQDQRKPPLALLLFSPWTDMTLTSQSYEAHKEDDPILTYDYITAVRDAYVGDSKDYRVSNFSPLYGDVSDFPPTLIQVGGHEILLDDSTKLAEKLQAAGSPVDLQIFDDGWHVFQQMPLPLASAAMKSVGEFVQHLLYEK